MNGYWRKNLIVVTVSAALLSAGASAFADPGSWDTIWSKPAVRQAAIGAGVGAAGGVLSDRTSVGKGALTGAMVGAGTGLLTQSQYFGDKPLVRNALQGAIVGTGVSYATGNNKMKGAVVGAGSGVGYHYIRKYLDTH